ncbi:N-acetylglucosamine kinase [Nonomuraea sediminis]|uniref:N-acetylglucosamine kinase n=1 Tax=Nonomuraea sediminis TaxID=2835864 RepID=UPI001BDCC1F9|nr:BadF/BadG/BcrA/BcrD ATPase family protein [Nonomuraea sediminis]
MTLTLGLDVGGSTTRALVADLDGQVVARATGGGGNPMAHGAAAVEEIAGTVRQVLAGLDPARVAAGVLGLAGGMSRYAPDFALLWPRLGLSRPPRLVSDVELAFVSGTDSASGSVLVSGTGAAAARIAGRTVTRTADGHGWLLGDLGSGVWIGREAIRHALRCLDRARTTKLAQAVLERFNHASIGEVIEAVQASPVTVPASLAPLVHQVAAEGDPDARRILVTAAAHLVTTLSVVRNQEEDSPIVLGGGMLAVGTLLGEVVSRSAAERWPAAPITHAGDGAEAAARLARHDLGKACP